MVETATVIVLDETFEIILWDGKYELQSNDVTIAEYDTMDECLHKFIYERISRKYKEMSLALFFEEWNKALEELSELPLSGVKR